MSWVVFADGADEVALWAYQELSARLAVPGRLVTAEQLTAGSWDYRLGGGRRRGVRATVRLADGHTLDAHAIGAALNRLAVAPYTAVAALGEDAGYAYGEWHALLTSWLHELGDRALNPPQAPSLAGPLLSHVQWLALAARAGLGVPRVSLSLDHTEVETPDGATDFWVVGDAIWSAAPFADPLRGSLLRLARMAGSPLLRVSVEADTRVAAVDAIPDLRTGGDEVVTLIARHFARLAA